MQRPMDETELKPVWNMIYNLSLHMLRDPFEAEDAAQSVLEKALKKLSDYRGDASFSTWVYRIGYNHLLDRLRRRKREEISFELFEYDVNHFAPCNNGLGLSREEEKIYTEELKVGCTLAMLQCLSPEDRFVFILITIFGFSSGEASAVCGISSENIRKKLSRAKKKIRNFLEGNCSLVNPQAFCRCRNRLHIAVERGRINPEKMLYISEDGRIRDHIREMNEIDSISRLYRNNPFFDRAEALALSLKSDFRILQDALSQHPQSRG